MSLYGNKKNLNMNFTNYPTYSSAADLQACLNRGKYENNPKVRPQTIPILNDSQMSTSTLCPWQTLSLL